MERNPLFLADSEYTARRSEVLRTFNQKEAAVFSLLENMYDLTTAIGELKHKFTWPHGHDSEEFLIGVFQRRHPSIPLPGFYLYTNGYQRFNWKILDRSDKKIAFFAVKMEFGVYGMRLSETVGESSFSQVSQDIDQLVGQIPYPVLVTDRTGFRHENRALIALKTA